MSSTSYTASPLFDESIFLSIAFWGMLFLGLFENKQNVVLGLIIIPILGLICFSSKFLRDPFD